jgi:hypothetical protein
MDTSSFTSRAGGICSRKSHIACTIQPRFHGLQVVEGRCSVTIFAENPQQLCRGVHDLASSDRQRLTARPWNMYEPENSLWWLVPSSEWPAFRYGKLFFDWTGDDRQTLWTGLNVEKGIGATAHAMYSVKHRMTNEWAWDQIVCAAKDGALDEVLALGTQAQPWRMHINVIAFTDKPSDFDPLSEKIRSSRARYEFVRDSGSATWHLENQNDPRKLAPQLSTMKRTVELKNQLDALPKIDWLWIDAYFGVFLTTGAGGPGVDPATTWFSYLRRFEHWLTD